MASPLTILRLRAAGSSLVVGPSTTPVEAALDRFERPQFCGDIMVTSGLREREDTHVWTSSQGTSVPVSLDVLLTRDKEKQRRSLPTRCRVYVRECAVSQGEGVRAIQQGSARCGQAHSWGASGGGEAAGA